MKFREIPGGISLQTMGRLSALFAELAPHVSNDTVRGFFSRWAEVDYYGGARRQEFLKDLFKTTKTILSAAALVADRWLASSKPKLDEVTLEWDSSRLDSDPEMKCSTSAVIECVSEDPADRSFGHAAVRNVTEAILRQFLADRERVEPPKRPVAYLVEETSALIGDENGAYVLDLSLGGSRYAFFVLLTKHAPNKNTEILAVSLSTLAVLAFVSDRFRAVFEATTKARAPLPDFQPAIGTPDKDPFSCWPGLVKALREHSHGWCQLIADVLEVETVQVVLRDPAGGDALPLAGFCERTKDSLPVVHLYQQWLRSDESWHERPDLASLPTATSGLDDPDASVQLDPHESLTGIPIDAATRGPILFVSEWGQLPKWGQSETRGPQYGLALIGRSIPEVWISLRRRRATVDGKPGIASTPQSRKIRIESLAHRLFGQLDLLLALAETAWKRRFQDATHRDDLDDLCHHIAVLLGPECGVDVVAHLPFALQLLGSSHNVMTRPREWFDPADGCTSVSPDKPIWDALKLGEAFRKWLSPSAPDANVFTVPVRPDRGFVLVVRNVPNCEANAPGVLRHLLGDAAPILRVHTSLHLQRKTTFRAWVGRTEEIPAETREGLKRALRNIARMRYKDRFKAVHTSRGAYGDALLKLGEQDGELASILQHHG